MYLLKVLVHQALIEHLLDPMSGFTTSLLYKLVQPVHFFDFLIFHGKNGGERTLDSSHSRSERL